MIANHQLFAWLITTAVIATLAMIYAAHVTHVLLATTAAWMFAVVAVVVAVKLNASLAHTEGESGAAIEKAALNASLMATTFGWGGSAILGAYFLTDLFWHHAWQYGLGMCLVGALIVGYRHALLVPGSRFGSPSWLTWSGRLALLQAIAAAIGLVFLITSGKFTRHNPDWIANIVFMAGGTSIVVLSIIAYRAQTTVVDRS